MLTEEMKKEILEDASSKERMMDFRVSANIKPSMSTEEYLDFLNDLQEIFGPFKTSIEKSIDTNYLL